MTRVLSLLALVFLVALAGPAAAHRRTALGSTAGLSIPSVSHGQMVALADNRAAIMQLTEDQYPTDSDMRRLQAFINLQHFYCGWGLFPGSMTDETSPFNECAHATLAGVRALLLHLQTMPGDRSAVRALSRTIDIEMLRHDAAMVLCRFSDEPFNSADVIIPSVGSIFADPSCLATILVLAFAAALCGGLMSMARASRPARAAGLRKLLATPPQPARVSQ